MQVLVYLFVLPIINRRGEIFGVLLVFNSMGNESGQGYRHLPGGVLLASLTWEAGTCRVLCGAGVRFIND